VGDSEQKKADKRVNKQIQKKKWQHNFNDTASFFSSVFFIIMHIKFKV